MTTPVEAPPVCENRHADPETGELAPATVRVYWVEPGASEEDPALGEAELCRSCSEYASEPWARLGAVTWLEAAT